MQYRLDRDDRIEAVSTDWLDFARANGAPDLTAENVIGRPLWDFVAGADTRHLYELMFRRARNDGVSFVVPFRCDAPTARRFMELVVHPAGRGGIDLEGRLVRGEKRDPARLLDPAVPRTNDSLMICSWCKKVRPEQTWLDAEIAITSMDLFLTPRLPQLTHGICPVCSDRVLKEIDADVA
ncbi:MAG: hypothetical protein HKN20_05270 [Gemmatimonadetes bacterium]|nr:hypothetical protein [Gemmatimonadota bacterium]